MLKARLVSALLALALATTSSLYAVPAHAASAADLNKDATAIMSKLYEKHPQAKTLNAKAKAVLIFPSVYKAGFMMHRVRSSS